MQRFQTIEKLDTAILYALELASSVSVLLLAFGLIASMANVLTQGSVLTDSAVMRQIWAWTQCIAIDASVAGTIIRTFYYHQEGERVKAFLYGLLSALLLFTAAIVSNIEAVQQTLNVTLSTAYTHVFVSIEVLTWIRSISVVLIIVAHTLRHVHTTQQREENPQPLQSQESTPQRFEITPDLIASLREALGVRVVEEVPETPALPERAGETDNLNRVLQELDSLLPSVSLDEITAVVSAYRAQVPRREMCSYLKWGGAKYTTIVKPVLDAYEQQEQQTGSGK
jgi:hypothetical protein